MPNLRPAKALNHTTPEPLLARDDDSGWAQFRFGSLGKLAVY
jgi:hypothetical protein